MEKPDKAILMVDDDGIILLTLRHELSRTLGPQYRYETAMSGQEGLEVIDELAAEGVRVVLIISDYIMPGMNGKEFICEVQKRNPEIHALMISGQAEPDIVADALESGSIKAFFSKPWNSVLLEKHCREILAQV